MHGDYVVVGASQSRHAYIFQKDGVNWQQVTRLTPHDQNRNTLFGSSVDMTDNVVVIGARQDGAKGSNSGAAYVFSRTDTGWVETAKLASANTNAGDQFGSSVAISGNTFLIGSPYNDKSAIDAGSVDIYNLSLAECSGLTIPDSSAYGNIPDGDQTHAEQVTYCFEGEMGDMYLSFNAYDIDTVDETEIFLNGVKISDIPVTVNNQWGVTEYVLLSEVQVITGGTNQIVFRQNNSDTWGIKNVALGNCYSMPFSPARGNFTGCIPRDRERVVYCFAGQPGDLYLNFQAFKRSTKDTVHIRLNGVTILDTLQVGRRWSTTIRNFIPDSLINDHGDNIIAFEKVVGSSSWAIREIFVDACLPLPLQQAKGFFPDGDEPHIKEVCFTLPEKMQGTNFFYQAFDIDSNQEVEILINDVKVYDVEVTPDLDWSGTRSVFINETMLNDSTTNHIAFRNSQNYHDGQKNYWGVREVDMARGLTLPFAEPIGSKDGYRDKMTFTFSGDFGDLYLYFEAFDIDDSNEVDITLNGIKIHDVAMTPADRWSDSRTILLPDSLIIKAKHPNTLVFDNTDNPDGQREWGMRNIAVDACLPLPSFQASGNFRHEQKADSVNVCYAFPGAPGYFNLSYQFYNSDSSANIILLVNDVEIDQSMSFTENNWSGTRSLLLDDAVIHDRMLNKIQFMKSGEQQRTWGVKNMILSHSQHLPHVGNAGRVHHGDKSHAYQASFTFPAISGDLRLFYEAYDIDNANEVEILLNGTKLENISPGPDKAWSESRSLLLPDTFVKDSSVNMISFNAEANPAHPLWWGVRNLRVEREAGQSLIVHQRSIDLPGQFTLELTEPQVFDQVFLVPQDNAGYYQTYRVEASNDGQVYHSLSEDSPALTQGSQLLSFPTVQARFIRFSGHGVPVNVDSLRALGLEGSNYWQTLGALLNETKPELLQLSEILLLQQDRTTAVTSRESKLPNVYQLDQNFPNPFNPATTIRFSLAKPGNVKLNIYNLNGQLLQSFLNKKLAAGNHQFSFDGKGLASGIYFYRLQAGEFVAVRKMMVAK